MQISQSDIEYQYDSRQPEAETGQCVTCRVESERGAAWFGGTARASAIIDILNSDQKNEEHAATGEPGGEHSKQRSSQCKDRRRHRWRDLRLGAEDPG